METGGATIGPETNCRITRMCSLEKNEGEKRRHKVGAGRVTSCSCCTCLPRREGGNFLPRDPRNATCLSRVDSRTQGAHMRVILCSRHTPKVQRIRTRPSSDGEIVRRSCRGPSPRFTVAKTISHHNVGSTSWSPSLKFRHETSL